MASSCEKKKKTTTTETWSAGRETHVESFEGKKKNLGNWKLVPGPFHKENFSYSKYDPDGQGFFYQLKVVNRNFLKGFWPQKINPFFKFWKRWETSLQLTNISREVLVNILDITSENWQNYLSYLFIVQQIWPKMYVTIYSDTHYEIIEFEVEGFLSNEKLKILQEQNIEKKGFIRHYLFFLKNNHHLMCSPLDNYREF